MSIKKFTKEERAALDRLEEQLKTKEKIISHIMTCLSIIKNTSTAEGLKDTPSLAKEFQEYIEQALKGN